MDVLTVPQLAIPTVHEAVILVNAWLHREVGMAVHATTAHFDPTTFGWHLPIELAYATHGTLGVSWAMCISMRPPAPLSGVPVWQSSSAVPSAWPRPVALTDADRYAQEQPTSCVAACVRMVLTGFEVVWTEGQVRTLLGPPCLGITFTAAHARLVHAGARVALHADWGLDDLLGDAPARSLSDCWGGASPPGLSTRVPCHRGCADYEPCRAGPGFPGGPTAPAPWPRTHSSSPGRPQATKPSWWKCPPCLRRHNRRSRAQRPKNVGEAPWHKTRGLPPPMCAILSPGNARVACHRFPGGCVSPMRAALSARVSTHDQHTLAMQMDALRACATKRHWTVTLAVAGMASGATAKDAAPMRALAPQGFRHASSVGKGNGQALADSWCRACCGGVPTAPIDTHVSDPLWRSRCGGWLA